MLYRTIATAVATCLTFASFSTVAENCNKLLEIGYTNTSSSISETDSITSAFTNICTKSYNYSASADQSELSIGLDFLDYIGIDFGSSDKSKSLQERRDYYCGLWESQSNYHNYASQQTKTIYQGALDAWTQCLELESSGVHIKTSYTPDLTAVTVTMWNGAGSNTKFTGLLQPQTGQATCQLTKGDGSAAINANENTRFNLGPYASTFNCKRKSSVDPKSWQSYYPQTRLTFALASANQINIDLPSLKLATVSTSEIRNLMTRISQLEANVIPTRYRATGYGDYGTD